MVIASTIAGTISLMDAAARVLENPRTQSAINRVNRTMQTGGSIAAYTQQTTILSRVYIDEAVLGEPILPNLMRTLHSYYTAQIVAALGLSQLVDDQRTVQDILSVVQDGHTASPGRIVGNVLGNHRTQSLIRTMRNRHMAQESFLTQYLGEGAYESLDHQSWDEVEHAERERHLNDRLEAATQGRDAARNKLKAAESELEKHKAENDRLKAVRNETAVRSIKTSDNRIGPMGELYEIKMSNPNGNGQPITVPIFIQMQPSLMSYDIAPRFIDMNVPESIWQRWTKMRAGELTFWKDFVGHRDLRMKNRAILKDPKAAAALQDFMKTVSKKDIYAMGDATGKATAHNKDLSRNLANSVVIFSEDAVATARVDSNINLHNPTDRQRYFDQAYMMMVVIVDPLHQRVTIYINGIGGEIDASYSDFRSKDESFDAKDFMTALQSFSSNNIGRLR